METDPWYGTRFQLKDWEYNDLSDTRWSIQIKIRILLPQLTGDTLSANLNKVP